MIKFILKYHFHPHSVTCWNCQSNDFVNSFICKNCKHLKEPCQSLHNVTYFQIFDLPLSMSIDIQQLENKYRTLQQKFHPDVFIAQMNMNDINIGYSQQYSAFINEAYQTLKNEASRAEYILNLRGYPIKENSQLDDLEFMEEILEKQQEIIENNNINKIQQENNKAIDLMLEQLKSLLQNQQYQQAYIILLYLRYRLRLKDQIDIQQQ